MQKKRSTTFLREKLVELTTFWFNPLSSGPGSPPKWTSFWVSKSPEVMRESPHPAISNQQFSTTKTSIVVFKQHDFASMLPEISGCGDPLIASGDFETQKISIFRSSPVEKTRTTHSELHSSSTRKSYWDSHFTSTHLRHKNLCVKKTFTKGKRWAHLRSEFLPKLLG